MRKKTNKSVKRLKRTKSIKTGPNVGQFVSIAPGTFQMGSPINEPHRSNYEIQHQVTLTKSFEMGVTQVNQEQWRTIMGISPSYFKGANLPVEQVSWDDCQAFIAKLNGLQNQYDYRLPTEAEWEYAARGGTQSSFCFGNNEDALPEYAWFHKNSKSKTHEVASLQPNAYGLYDMHGNVWEWCQDRYGDYSGMAETDPEGPISGSYRVIRGGGWINDAAYLRAVRRSSYSPGSCFIDIGFRLVRTLRNPSLPNPLTLGTDAAKRAEILFKISEIKKALNELEDLLK